MPSSQLGPLGAILPYAKPDLRCYEMVSVHGEPPLGILAYFRMIIGIVTNQQVRDVRGSSSQSNETHRELYNRFCRIRIDEVVGASSCVNVSTSSFR